MITLYLNLCHNAYVQVGLGANLEGDIPGGAPAVPNSFGTSLGVPVYAVIVAGAENTEVVETMDGDRVIRSSVTNGGRITSNRSGWEGIGGFQTKMESVSTDNLFRNKKKNQKIFST